MTLNLRSDFHVKVIYVVVVKAYLAGFPFRNNFLGRNYKVEISRFILTEFAIIEHVKGTRRELPIILQQVQGVGVLTTLGFLVLQSSKEHIIEVVFHIGRLLVKCLWSHIPTLNILNSLIL